MKFGGKECGQRQPGDDSVPVDEEVAADGEEDVVSRQHLAAGQNGAGDDRQVDKLEASVADRAGADGEAVPFPDSFHFLSGGTKDCTLPCKKKK